MEEALALAVEDGVCPRRPSLLTTDGRANRLPTAVGEVTLGVFLRRQQGLGSFVAKRPSRSLHGDSFSVIQPGEQMTIPDKPNSRLQTYRLTAAGRAAAAQARGA